MEDNVKSELIKRYVYLYQNKELILALCIGRGIETKKIKENIKKCNNLLRNNKCVMNNEILISQIKEIIDNYLFELKNEKYYLMSSVNDDIVSMFEEFLFSDEIMENLRLYKHIEAVKSNKDYFDAFNYSIELLEERRQFNIQLRKLPTFTVWKILSYVRRKNENNKIILSALDKYYNIDRYIIAEDNCIDGYYMLDSEYSTRYDKYPSDFIVTDGIIFFSYKNCFEKEDDYFVELASFDKTDDVESWVSNFMIELAYMPNLDIESKIYIKNDLIKSKGVIKKYNNK